MGVGMPAEIKLNEFGSHVWAAFDGYAYRELVDALAAARQVVSIAQSVIASGSTLSKEAKHSLDVALRAINLIENELALRTASMSKM